MDSQLARLGSVAGIILMLIFCAASRVAIAQGAAAPPAESAATVTAAAVDVLTQHNDPQRTGVNLKETMLTPESVKSGRFGLLFDWPVDGQIYAQPLYVSQVPYQGRTIDMIIVATMNNSVYAFEAPASNSIARPSASPIWHIDNKSIGEPLPYKFMDMTLGVLGRLGFLGRNIKPLIGITSTPVIDRNRNRVYVVAKSRDGQNHYYNRLFALNLLTGRVEKQITIGEQVNGFDAKMQLQRPGLLEANDRIYVALGSHEDTMPYHGWVFAYDADDLTNVAKYCTTCAKPDSVEGGVWQAGSGLTSDLDGNVYVMTGNGSFDPATADRGDSFIKFDKNLAVLGSWTPANHSCLDFTDSDLGSAGPVFDAASKVLFGGGKEGVLFALTSGALHGTQIGTGHPPAKWKLPCGRGPEPDANGEGYWSIQAAPTWHSPVSMFRSMRPAASRRNRVPPTATAARRRNRWSPPARTASRRTWGPAELLTLGYHHIHGAPAIWHVRDASGDRTILYMSAERDLLRAHEFRDGFANDAPPGAAPKDTYHSWCANSGMGMPGGFLSISANGGSAASGIVWAAMPMPNQNALNHIKPGILRAYKAVPDSENELAEIWNSLSGIAVKDRVGCKDDPAAAGNPFLFAKFVAPTVAVGKVYLATFSCRLDVYGLRPVAPAPDQLVQHTNDGMQPQQGCPLADMDDMPH